MPRRRRGWAVPAGGEEIYGAIRPRRYPLEPALLILRREQGMGIHCWEIWRTWGWGPFIPAWYIVRCVRWRILAGLNRIGIWIKPRTSQADLSSNSAGRGCLSHWKVELQQTQELIHRLQNRIKP